PYRLSLELAEADAPIRCRLGEEDSPPIVRQLDVFEMRPPLGIDADRGPEVDLVIVLESLRPHFAPPLQVFRLPVFERSLQALVAGEVDVVRNPLGRNH